MPRNAGKLFSVDKHKAVVTLLSKHLLDLHIVN